MSEKGILKKIDDIFNYCEEIDNHLPKEEQTGYNMLPDIFYIQKEVRNLQQKVEQLENIRKEIKKEIKKYAYTDTFGDTVVLAKYIEDILNKGDNNGK